MKFEAFGRKSARRMLKNVGGPVTYHGAGGDVETVGMIGIAIHVLGGDSLISERRQVCAMLVEDVPSARKGETVTDHVGTWYLDDELEADEWFTNWSVTKVN